MSEGRIKNLQAIGLTQHNTISTNKY